MPLSFLLSSIFVFSYIHALLHVMLTLCGNSCSDSYLYSEIVEASNSSAILSDILLSGVFYVVLVILEAEDSSKGMLSFAVGLCKDTSANYISSQQTEHKGFSLEIKLLTTYFFAEIPFSYPFPFPCLLFIQTLSAIFFILDPITYAKFTVSKFGFDCEQSHLRVEVLFQRFYSDRMHHSYCFYLYRVY